MATKVRGEAIKEGSIPFSALDKNINKDIPVLVGNTDEESLNRFKYMVENVYGIVYCIMQFNDVIISGKINSTYGGRHQITGVIISSSTDKFKEGDGIRIGGGSGEFLTPLCESYVEVTSCGLTYENTTSVDPIVWKYICNPCIAEVGNTVPSELIIRDQDYVPVFNYRDKPSMYKVKYEGNIYNVTYVEYQTLEFIKDNTTLYMVTDGSTFTEISDMP